MPDDPQRTLLVTKMVAEGTRDDDIRATLAAFDKQNPVGPPVTTQRLAAEGPSAMRGPNGPNGEAPRMVAAHPYATAALLAGGAAAPFIPAGATAVEAAYPGMLKDVAKLAGVGLGYRAGKAVGVPEPVLDFATLAAGYDPAMNIRSVWKGAKAEPIPEPTPTAKIPPLKPAGDYFDKPASAPIPPLRPIAPDAPAPRITGIKQVPLSPNTRSSWPSGEPPVPQQTSSIQPTPNAVVNLDKGAPLPTDEARTFSTGVTDPGERARMSETHTVLNQENNAYRAMKNDAGPDAGAVLREALLKKGTTADDLTPTVGPALLQALLDSLKTGGR